MSIIQRIKTTLLYLDRLNIQEENIWSMKIRANDIDLADEKHFNSFFLQFLTAKLNIDIVGSNFLAQNVLFRNLQSA